MLLRKCHLSDKTLGEIFDQNIGPFGFSVAKEFKKKDFEDITLIIGKNKSC